MYLDIYELTNLSWMIGPGRVDKAPPIIIYLTFLVILFLHPLSGVSSSPYINMHIGFLGAKPFIRITLSSVILYAHTECPIIF